MKNELRKEYKKVVNNFEVIKFLKKFDNKLNEIYQPRIITSLYFDTINYSLYKASLDQDVDTFKIRVRTYSNNKFYYKEIKKNLFSGKHKIIEKIEIKDFNDIKTINRNGYVFYPAVFTQYKRQYFNFDNNCRVTIDSDINFISHEFRTPVEINIPFNMKILEFKQFNNNLNIEKYLHTNPEAFSKYKFGIEKLYGI